MTWKSDPVHFLKLKVHYGQLLGFLHGLQYIKKQYPEMEGAVNKLYEEVYDKVDDELQEITGETFNCGWADQEPSIEWIINDESLNKLFPINKD